MNKPILPRLVLLVAGAAALAGSGWAVARMLRNPSPGNPVAQQRRAAQDRKERGLDRWLALEKFPLQGISRDQVAGMLGEQFSEWLGELDPDRFAALMDALAGHIVVRVDPSLDSYVSFAEQDPTTRWATPEDARAWNAVTHWYAYHTGREQTEVQDVNLFEMLGANIELQAIKNRGAIESLAVGEGASWGKVLRIRSVEESLFQISEAMSPEQSSYWFESSGQAGIPFQVSVPSLEQAVGAHGAVQMVAVCLIVRTVGGSVWNLHSRWFWDTSQGRWICELYSRKSHDNKAFIWF